jgi:drug/metabolite transporter (DMT)-like permease
MLAVLLALASAAGYGSSDYTGGMAARQASLIRITVLAQGVSVVLIILVLPLAGLRAPALGSLAWGAAGGLAGALGALSLYAGFRRAAFSVVGPISAIGSAGFSVLAGLLLGERPGPLAMIGIGLALPAILGVSASPGSARPGPRPDQAGQGGSGQAGHGSPAAGVLWGLTAGAGFAVLFIALNRAGSHDGLYPVAASQIAALAVVLGLGVTTGDVHLPPRRASELAALTGVLGTAGTVLYFYATQAGLLAVTAVLTSLYPAVTIVLARAFARERLTAVRLTGLCLAGVSVGLIAAAGAG